MNPQTDRLFQDKLFHHQKPAPAHAWSRIEKNLQRRRSKIYWQAAAGIVLVLMAGWSIYASRQQLKEKQQAQVPKQPIVHEQKEVAEEAVVIPETKVSVQRAVVRRRPVNPITPTEILFTHSPSDVQENPDVVQNQPMHDNLGDITVQSTPAGKTIYITLEEARLFLKSEIPADDATPFDKMPSRMQRLVLLTNAFSAEVDLLGELRSRKNNLLVLDLWSVRVKTNDLVK